MLIFMASPTPLDCLQHSLLTTIYHKGLLQRYEQHSDINIIKRRIYLHYMAMLETLHFLGNNSTIYFFIDIGNT